MTKNISVLVAAVITAITLGFFTPNPASAAQNWWQQTMSGRSYGYGGYSSYGGDRVSNVVATVGNVLTAGQQAGVEHHAIEAELEKARIEANSERDATSQGIDGALAASQQQAGGYGTPVAGAQAASPVPVMPLTSAAGPYYFYAKNTSAIPVELVGNGNPLGLMIAPGKDAAFGVPDPNLRIGARRPYLKQDKLTVSVEWLFMKTIAGGIAEHELGDGSKVQAFEFTIGEP